MESTLNNKTSHKIPKYVYSLCVLHKKLWDFFFLTSIWVCIITQFSPLFMFAAVWILKIPNKKGLTLYDQRYLFSLILLGKMLFNFVISFVLQSQTYYGCFSWVFLLLFWEFTFKVQCTGCRMKFLLFGVRFEIKYTHFQEDHNFIFKNFKNIKKNVIKLGIYNGVIFLKFEALLNRSLQ